MKTQRVSLWIVVVFAVVLSFSTALRAAPVKGQGQRIDRGQVPAGLAVEDWDRILAQLPAGYDETNKLSASDAGADDRFGQSVAISGDTLVVGAYHEDGDPGDPLPSSGAAYVFQAGAEPATPTPSPSPSASPTMTATPTPTATPTATPGPSHWIYLPVDRRD